MVRVTQHYPRAIVSFTTETGELVARVDPEKEGSLIDAEVLSITTSNDVGSDAGTFQIELAARMKWDRKLASNDFVRIRMYRDADSKTPSEFYGTVFVGLIDDVRKSTNLQSGTPIRSVTVTGRTFAKALINFEIGVIQEVAITEGSLGWFMGRVTFAGESAASIMQQVFEKFVFEYMNYTFENKKTFKKYTRLLLASREGEQLFDDKSFVNYQGSMNAFLKEISNEPFNQMFWEASDDGFATFVLRPTPFNEADWTKLVTHTITDELVVNDSTGRSDIETYAFFSVGMANYFSSFDVNKTTGVLPYWYKPYYEKFGLRRLHRLTGYAGFAGAAEDLDTDALKAYQQDLFNWNILNPSYYNGQITVRGDHRYKIGDRLLYDSAEAGTVYEYFIESVSHEFINFSYWITKLGVTRGLRDSGKSRFESPWGEYEEYEGGALGVPAGSVGDGGTTGSPTDNTVSFPPSANASEKATQIIEYAKTWIGRSSYVWGGGRNQSDISRGRFDCSSFVHHCFAKFGVNLGGGIQTDYLAKQGKAVSIMNLEPGDLVFFNTYKYNGHIGIYMGGGKWIGCQSNVGAQIQDMDGSYWKSEGYGSMRRVL